LMLCAVDNEDTGPWIGPTGNECMLKVPVSGGFSQLGCGFPALRKHPHGPPRNQPNTLIYKRFYGSKGAGRDDVCGAGESIEKRLDSHMMDHIRAGCNPDRFAQKRCLFHITFNEMHRGTRSAHERSRENEAGESGA